MKQVLEFMVSRRHHISLFAISNVESLHRFRKTISCNLSLADIKKLDTAIHTGANDSSAHALDLWNRIFEPFDDFDGMVGFASVVPTAYWSIVAGANLSVLDHTITLFSGLKQTELILAVCPVYFLIYLPSMTSVSMMFLSPPPLINLELSLLMSTE